MLIWGTYYHKFGQNIKIFKILCTKYMASSEVMTSSTHSLAYSYRLVKKCFVKICETSKCHNFLIFQPMFIRFSLLCSKNVTIFLKFKLNLFRISPLKPAVDSDISKIKVSGTAKAIKWWCSGAEYVKICENDMFRIGNLGLKMGVSRAAHTQYAYIWKYPPPPPRSGPHSYSGYVRSLQSG